MRLLLDTHVAIWWDAGHPLSPNAYDAIASAHEVYLSAASGWELAIKTALGKVTTSRSLATVASDSGFLELPVLLRHTERLAELPPLCRDPFDRLLVAQALVEGLTLVTRDAQLVEYPVATIAG